MLGIQQRDSVANLAVGINSTTYSFLANSPLVSQINFTNAGSWRMTTTKTYDFLNRLTQIASTPSASPAISFAYAYNNANQRTAVTNADGTYWLYGYDALGQVTSGVKYFNNGVPVPGEQFGYAFDNIGNRTSTTAGGDQNGNNLRTATYGANLNNQYTNRTVPGAVDILGSAVTNATVTVNNQPTYRNGTFYEATLALTNTSAAVWQSITNLAVAHSSSTTDLVATVTGNTFLQQTPEAFSYDSDGNLIQDGRWTYTWDGENRLIQMVSLTNAPTASKLRLTFAYDSKWRRISKGVEAYNGMTWTTNLAESFVYDGWNLVDELNATNNSVTRSYIWGLDLQNESYGSRGVGALLSITCNTVAGSTNCFAAYDCAGNIVAFISANNGSIQSKYEYGSFGENVLFVGSKASPFKFSSKYQDDESELYYFGHRYYDPHKGDWIGRDPDEEGGGLNLTCFTSNDPNSRYDPDGLLDFKITYDEVVSANDQYFKENRNSVGNTVLQAWNVKRTLFKCSPDCAKYTDINVLVRVSISYRYGTNPDGPTVPGKRKSKKPIRTVRMHEHDHANLYKQMGQDYENINIQLFSKCIKNACFNARSDFYIAWAYYEDFFIKAKEAEVDYLEDPTSQYGKEKKAANG